MSVKTFIKPTEKPDQTISKILEMEHPSLDYCETGHPMIFIEKGNTCPFCNELEIHEKFMEDWTFLNDQYIKLYKAAEKTAPELLV
jgi:hypothetical protein